MFCGRLREVWREGVVQRGGGIESNSKLATLPWAKAHLITDIPGRVPTCATPRPTESTDTADTQPDDDKMPDSVVGSPYPLIDADPHFTRVVRYMRSSDYAVWAGATAAFPSALYFWGM